MDTAILLATYNSSKYIREQLDSLYNQTYKDWILYVHDDGSNDNTLDIITEYKKRYKNIVLLGEEIKHLGPKKNFMYLLNNVQADYYFFCDHDDVWFENKVELSLREIQNMELGNKNIPVIFHSDLTVVDGKLNVISQSMWKYAKIIPDLMHRRNYVMTSCYITGCTLSINNAAKKLIPPMPENAIMHDWWIGIHAVLQNMKIISWHQSTMLYRLHGANDSGIPRVTIIKYLKRIIGSLFISNYDRHVKPFVKKYGIKHYSWFKTLLILRKLSSK